MSTDGDVTRLLQQLGGGASDASDALWPLVYHELRRLAQQYLRREGAAHTLQPTALVNEAFLKLLRGRAVAYQDRNHFFAVASQAMRRILIDHARRSQAAKRGGGQVRVALSSVEDACRERDAYLVALDDALDDLARLDSELSAVVELRFFGGLTIEEAAEVLGIAPITVQRRWRMARGWLHRHIGGEAGS